jgi:hypothetical protein
VEELAEPVCNTGWDGLHWLAREVTLDVCGEAVGDFVAAVAVFLQSLHYDPVELTPQQLCEFR